MVCTAIKFNRSEIFTYYSNYSKLIHVTAWCLRFVWNFHWCGPFLSGPLELFEIKQATDVLILVQKEFFLDEMKALKADIQIKPKSPISSLSPFLDALNTVRVGGQLKNSGFSYEQCYQILLLSQYPFTKLLISYEHIKHLHAGPNLLRSVLRRKFWILQQNRAISNLHSKMCTVPTPKGQYSDTNYGFSTQGTSDSCLSFPKYRDRLL